MKKIFYWHGMPIYAEPTFDILDPPVPDIKVGDTWTTLGLDTVKVIARHSDGDFEITVLRMRSVYNPPDERRGTRVGSSYIVDKYGKVKPGHLAPPASMHLDKKVDTTKGKSAYMRVMDEMWPSYATEIAVAKPTPKKPFVERPEFREAVHKVLDERRPKAVEDTKAMIDKAIDTAVSVMTIAMRGEMDAKIQAYHDKQPKFFVGKTYVTRNGSQVKITGITGTYINGKTVRGGDSAHPWGGINGWCLDGRKYRSRENQMDLMHEVVGE